VRHARWRLQNLILVLPRSSAEVRVERVSRHAAAEPVPGPCGFAAGRFKPGCRGGRGGGSAGFEQVEDQGQRGIPPVARIRAGTCGGACDASCSATRWRARGPFSLERSPPCWQRHALPQCLAVKGRQLLVAGILCCMGLAARRWSAIADQQERRIQRARVRVLRRARWCCACDPTRECR